MSGRVAAAIVLLALAARPVAAHTATPEALVAELDGGPAAAAAGVQHAERDRRNPRLLVIRVGARWYRLQPAARRELAAGWHERWRATVRGGVVAVLDARTDAPVVGFGPGGVVTGVVNPPGAGADATPPITVVVPPTLKND